MAEDSPHNNMQRVTIFECRLDILAGVKFVGIKNGKSCSFVCLDGWKRVCTHALSLFPWYKLSEKDVHQV